MINEQHQAENDGFRRALGNKAKFTDEVCDKNSQLNAIIQQLEAELDKHRYIPVIERLPKFGQWILTYNPKYKPKVSVNIEAGDRNRDDYTHWKPIILPEGE